MKQVSASIGKDRYKTILTGPHHSLVSDEPVEYSGQNLGPAPEELLLMSLASCTAITLRMYADRKQMDIDGFDVKIASDKIGDKFIFNCEVAVTGIITEEERIKLTRIAEACPIHKILTHPIEVNTTLA